ncbi:hypothetical protein C2G38_2187058 [Gigaspora rosea]|uniref:BED-type domain-containing protein n=1 Tax=Gigaspora rosea TaxID=44941 RepID=A0A397V7A2_9GLOM|nr:hypothetical protein C2G38_2187058 [Gigaspora rosea]
MSSSSAMPYNGIYEETCDERYGEPYDEFYDEPYDEPHDEPYDELYNRLYRTILRKKIKNKKGLFVLTAVCNHCGNSLKIRKDESISSFRKHLIRLHKNKVPELKGLNEPHTEPPQNVFVLDMLKSKAVS